MNEIGQGKLYKRTEQENVKYAQSEEWENTAMNEKMEYHKEIFMSAEDHESDVSFTPLEQVEEDSGYEQYLYDPEENDEITETS